MTTRQLVIFLFCLVGWTKFKAKQPANPS